jgi:hypothetical protein
MPYIESPSFLRKNGTSDARKDYAISITCWDIRQPLINGKKEKDSRKNIILIPQHEY